MIRRLPLTNDNQRLTWLQTFLGTARLNKRDVPPGLMAQADALQEPFRLALRNNQNILADRNRDVIRCDKHLGNLAGLVRAFWNNLKVRTQLEGHTADVLILYGLTLSGKRPIPRVKRDWLHWAQLIVDGDQQAVALGYPSMGGLFGTTVAAVLEETSKACLALDDVALRYQANLGGLIALRANINQHYDRVARYFGFLLGEQPKPTRREVMRTYGFHFQGDNAPKPGKTTEEPKSQPEPEPATAKAPTPPVTHDSSAAKEARPTHKSKAVPPPDDS